MSRLDEARRELKKMLDTYHYTSIIYGVLTAGVVIMIFIFEAIDPIGGLFGLIIFFTLFTASITMRETTHQILKLLDMLEDNEKP